MATPLGMLDRLFLQLESPTTPMHVGGVLVFRSARAAGARLAQLRAAAVQASPFDWVLGNRRGRPAWERITGAMPPVGHLHLAGGADAALMAAVSRLHGPHLDRARPLWECHLIEGLADDRFALYFKIHHACIDGVSAIRRLEASLDTDPAVRTPPPWASAPPPRPPRTTAHRASLGDSARTTVEVGRWLGRLALAARDRDPARTASPYTAPPTPLNDLLGAGRQVAWQRLPLAGIRAIASAAGVTLNEVALALCGAMLRAHLTERGALPDRPLVAMVPVSLRGAGDHAGNQVGSILVKLGTDLADPRARLRAVAASSAAGKQMIRAMSPAAAAAFSLAYTFPAVVAQLAGLARFAVPPFNVVISNVAGPQRQLYFDGAPLEAIYPVSLLFERQALNITLVSCRDHLDIGLLACARSIGDVHGLAAGLVDGYLELGAALGLALPPPEA
jgi:WS/DGAT/MGAT family acyltransferase